MELDKEMLAENLEKVPELDEEIRDRSSMLRVLLLVIAGDMRVWHMPCFWRHMRRLRTIIFTR